MKRLRRIVFNTLTAISLLLAIATAGLWVRGIFIRDVFNYFRLTSDRNPQGLWLYMESGQITVVYQRYAYVVIRKETEFPLGYRHMPVAVQQYRLLPKGSGFNFRTMSDYIATSWTLGFPHWAAIIFFLSPVFLWAVKSRHRHAKDSSHCPACGYDMRANPARCSECGREAEVVAP